jgi:predicted TIM-barrel fold metal-dependent hydrolase
MVLINLVNVDFVTLALDMTGSLLLVFAFGPQAFARRLRACAVRQRVLFASDGPAVLPNLVRQWPPPRDG